MNDTMRGAFIAGASAVAGSLLSGTYQHYRDWFHRPKLEFNIHSDNMHGPPYITEGAWDDKNQRVDKIFARVSFRNTGRTPALNCRVFLLTLDEVVTAQVTNRRRIYESFQLPWAGNSFEGKNLPAGIVVFADLARFDKTSPGWDFASNLPESLREELQCHHGTFKFGLVGTADNANPTTSTICVDYWGDWHKISIWDEQQKS